MIICDLIIDGNFILSKLVFTLNKNNILYGSLQQALNNAIANYRRLHPFSNVYLVSDSKEKSWRKKIIGEYKSQRKRDNDIDWKFVYQTYSDFKEELIGVKVMEAPHVEGDDWISYCVNKSNSEGRSTIIVSNDHDIKQLLKYSMDPLWINIMINEMYGREKLFIPNNYQIFINKVSKLPNDDIFNLNDNSEFLSLLDRFITKYNIVEIDPVEELFLKLVSGDKSDNINSAWFQIKNGKKRGIGIKGAQGVYDRYIEEFGEIELNDPDLFENIADLICEKKKLSKTKISDIVENIEFNSKLIDLRIDNIPDEIVDKMKEIYGD